MKSIVQLQRAVVATGLNKKNFDVIQHRLYGFINSRYHRSDITLSEINHSFILEFEKYLMDACRYSVNTTAETMMLLKRIIRSAMERGWIDKDPFAGYTIRKEQPKREYLSNKEINSILKCNFTNKQLEQVRDVFCFSCFTGLTYIDITQLQKGHIHRIKGGGQWIMSYRQKTDVEIKIPLLDTAKAILKKYENKQKNMILPVMSQQKTNLLLKEIGNLCGIKKGYHSSLPEIHSLRQWP